MNLDFVIADWSAYADGMTTKEQWLAWARGAASLPRAHLTEMPAVAEMPALVRRRIDRLGRLACQVAYWCDPSASAIPLVFASRYGDACRSLSLLADLVEGDLLSPTSFGLSVHNAISAQYSIARAHRLNTVVVSAGTATVEAALVEASALLAEGVSEVMVVNYEAPLPEAYACFDDEVRCEYAWAWLVRAAANERHNPTLRRLRVALGERHLGASVAPSTTLPGGLEILRFVLTAAAADDHGAVRETLPRTGGWTWSSHA